jgi:sugar lactone lactonase YvrE
VTRARLLLIACLIASTDAWALDPPEFVTKWGSQGSQNGQFYFPSGIEVDSRGRVYVAEEGNHRIQVFDADGNFLRAWGTEGSADGQFRNPTGVAVSADSRVYVVEAGNRRVQAFDSTGTFLFKWGSFGSSDGQFQTPVGISVAPDGRVYVADRGNSRIQVFSPNGAFLRKWGSHGSGDGQFNYPFDVGVDVLGNVYVVDSRNRRVQKFGADGTFISTWGHTGSGDGEFSSPRGIHVRPDGRVYVADFNNYRVQCFTDTGAFLVKWGSQGSADGFLERPSNVALDASGHVYVTEWDNHRVQKFGFFNYLGIFADSAGTQSGLCVTSPGSTTLHLVATTGTTTEFGVTGAEFSIQVTNPTGYNFSYTPPAGAFSSQYPFDLTPNDSTDAAGTVVLLADCQPDSGSPGVGNKVYFGAVNVLNFAGGTTELLVRRKNPPDNPGMPCPRFFLCDAPIFSPTCMNQTPGNDLVYWTVLGTPCPSPPPVPSDPQNLTASDQPTAESVQLSWESPVMGPAAGYNIYRSADGSSFLKINTVAILDTSFVDSLPVQATLCYYVTAYNFLDEESPPSGQVCVEYVPVFVPETLSLDLYELADDGTAGPITTSQILDRRRSYMMTVQGTGSVWPSTSWGPPSPLICGFPETSPQTPSPGVTNHWVGLDPEIIFSVPLPDGGDCDSLESLGYPKHPGWLLFDLGSGFSHVEPVGGAPSDVGPGHSYRYLVQGQHVNAAFAWSDSLTSDNYGVFTIIIDEAIPTDVLERLPRFRDLTVLPGRPNPFNPRTEIRYVLPSASRVAITIHDVRGRLLRRLFAGVQGPGVHAMQWNGLRENGERVPSGTYLVTVSTPTAVGRTKLTLLK